MDGARGLSSTEQVQQPGPDGIHGRRHRQAGEGDYYEHDEYPKITELLQDVVIDRLDTLGKVQARVVFDGPPQICRLEFLAGRYQISPEVAIEQTPESVKNDTGRENPRKCQVPTA